MRPWFICFSGSRACWDEAEGSHTSSVPGASPTWAGSEQLLWPAWEQRFYACALITGSHRPWEQLKSPVGKAFAPSHHENMSCRFCCGPLVSQDAQIGLIHLADLVRFGLQTVCSFLSLFFFLGVKWWHFEGNSSSWCLFFFFGKTGIRAKSSSWWWGAQETKAAAATCC